ncbi:hypothetical protein G3I60_00620 [Streptomyces sp. SID13666]|uniref:hypothetical protein n=1 Tax=unclassified Streptomyces TaxID=2593676 RepID=UPI0013C239C3|nr:MULTISPECIES: hypothetical protein [unclassified Streptomyces]NEA52714.1 hypothetical protein [Streptomyces sp. SID13666]NEA69959.1 hypothetical protein [Streptomyces sp. SID13588]
MNEVLAVLDQLRDAGELSGETAADALGAAGWAVNRQFAGESFTRHWERGELVAGIQGDGPDARVEFSLWLRAVDGDEDGDADDWDPDADADDLDAAYEAAEAALAGLVNEAEAPLAATGFTAVDESGDADEDATGGLDYIAHRAWRAGRRVFLRGAIQDDTDLPVRVVAVVT